MNVRRIFYGAGAFFLLLVKFTFDIVGKNVPLETGVGGFIRDLAGVGIFVLLFLLTEGIRGRREQPPVRRLMGQMVVIAATIAAILALLIVPAEGFDAKSSSLFPLDYTTIFVSSLIAVIAGSFCVLLVQSLRDFVLQDRRRSARRNFLILAVCILASTATGFFLRPLEGGIVPTAAYIFTLLAIVANSFRFPWIVYLTKREKILSLALSFVNFLLMTGFNVVMRDSAFPGRAVLFYSHPLGAYVQVVALFGNIYFGMAFVSTLFHLPTAEAFDRKRTEVTSLGALSRLITRVLDFNELVDSVTAMTMQVSEAKSCWLELLPEGEDQRAGTRAPDGAMQAARNIQVVSVRNIDPADIRLMVGGSDRSVRNAVLADRRPVLVDDIAVDPRFAHLEGSGLAQGSMAVVPLLSHDRPVGILYATKANPFGFVHDDIEVISAFADQATIAIENSRLIKTSIEKERLLREMLLAQEMQRKLLPQEVPTFPAVQIDASSTPAFEVGGDYYDFMRLGPTTIGIIIGDVSGKGVSAAFYMSEVKGIFQALARMYMSPRDFMVKANEAMSGSIDKHSFVSLIYGILDAQTGILTVARAGHCPMLLVTKTGARYLRPGGMGIGLGDSDIFSSSIEEVSVRLSEGDVCVFYTDGVTEARHGADEFGYERLMALSREARHQSASDIKERILGTVRTFTDGQPNHDDLTVVVLKWQGNSATGDIAKPEVGS